MIHIDEAFHTYADARAFVDRTLRRYHPAGYGTSLRITKGQDGLFRVIGHRFRSCD